jgi:hypothetical protein
MMQLRIVTLSSILHSMIHFLHLYLIILAGFQYSLLLHITYFVRNVIPANAFGLGIKIF